MLSRNFITGLVTYFAITLASPLPVKNDTPSICGTIDLANGATQKLYTGACYELEGVAREVHVLDACDCEFFL